MVAAGLALALVGPAQAVPRRVAATQGALTANPADGALTANPAEGALTANPAVLHLSRSFASRQYSLTPAMIHSVYGLPKTGARHQTIAIVSAYSDPGVQFDLSAYSRRFGLPACTKANRCLRILNEAGGSSPLPGPDPSGGFFVTESSVGVEVAHGVCESCSIMLVEANTGLDPDLSTAVQTAARAGAGIIVVTFNEGEGSLDTQYEPDFSSTHAIVVAAAGDQGYIGGALFPASLPNVLAVGGTHLNETANGRYGGESVWNMTTSGCSAINKAPTWQAADAASVGCGSQRAVADLAAVADPGPLVHIKDVGQPCGPSWCEADGTSVAAPIIAGVIGLAGSAGSSEAQMLYEHARTERGVFHAITRGAELGCSGQAICTARAGYSGPAGLGTPNGLAAFLANGGAIARRHPAVTVVAPHGRLRASRRFVVRLAIHNGNPFALTGTVALRARVRIGRRLRTITFAAGKLSLGSLQSGAVWLVVSTRQRALLRRLRMVVVVAMVRVRGPAGGPATLHRKLALFAP